MRKMRSSGKTLCSVSLSSRADCQVAPERLLDDDPAPLVQPDRRQRLGDRREHVGRDRHVVHGRLRPAPVERGGQRLPRRRAPRSRPGSRSSRPHMSVDDLPRRRPRRWPAIGLAGVGPEVVVGPVAAGDADDRDRQLARVARGGTGPGTACAWPGRRWRRTARGRRPGGWSPGFDDHLGALASTRVTPSARRGRRTRRASPTAPCRRRRTCPRELKRWNSAADSTGTGHALVDRRVDRPATLAGVADPAREGVEAGVGGERLGGQVEQPAGDRPSPAATPR